MKKNIEQRIKRLEQMYEEKPIKRIRVVFFGKKEKTPKEPIIQNNTITEFVHCTDVYPNLIWPPRSGAAGSEQTSQRQRSKPEGIPGSGNDESDVQ